jgi:hypothetical protein
LEQVITLRLGGLLQLFFCDLVLQLLEGGGFLDCGGHHGGPLFGVEVLEENLAALCRTERHGDSRYEVELLSYNTATGGGVIA